MTALALIVVGIVLLAGFGLVGWLRRVVASVDENLGRSTESVSVDGDEAATRSKHRSSSPPHDEYAAVAHGVKHDLRWLGNFRSTR